MSLTKPCSRLPYTAYLLAAGKSRRFGSNKAFALWQGTPFLNHQLSLLGAHFMRVKVVAPTPDAYQFLGVARALVDRFPGQGPLAGLDVALQDALANGQAYGRQADWVFLASCDTFCVEPEDIFTLAQVLPAIGEKYQAVLWKQKQRLEPLWGFYATSLASIVYQRLCEGRLPMYRLLADLQVKSYERPLPWIQVNAPTDFPEKA